jgi:hypothetical protein
MLSEKQWKKQNNFIFKSCRKKMAYWCITVARLIHFETIRCGFSCSEISKHASVLHWCYLHSSLLDNQKNINEWRAKKHSENDILSLMHRILTMHEREEDEERIKMWRKERAEKKAYGTPHFYVIEWLVFFHKLMK